MHSFFRLALPPNLLCQQVRIKDAHRAPILLRSIWAPETIVECGREEELLHAAKGGAVCALTA